ncbi:hypothetical protein MKW92_038680, partial [Papaver armeniacum]
DLALKYSVNLISEDEDSSKPIPGSKSKDFACTSGAEDRNKPALEVKIIPPEDEEDTDSDEDGFAFREDIPSPPLEEWVDSWKVKNYHTRFAWAHVYAYHSKDKGYGGYGVILRNMDAKPITASAMFSAQGKSC